MKPLDIYKQVASEFVLIDYSSGPTRQFVDKTIYLTEDEAHGLNQSMALNGITKRYVKTTPRRIYNDA